MERIVSLLPSATEILFAIGAGSSVVGVTHECDFPAEARLLPAVTSNLLDHDGKPSSEINRHVVEALHEGSGIYAIDDRLLASLSPDLIVTQELCEVCAVSYCQVVRSVRKLPATIPILSLEPSTVDGIFDAIIEVGSATGHSESAIRLVHSLKDRRDSVAKLSPPPRITRVVCIEWTDPLMVAGHWVPEMVALAGGLDVLGDAGEPSRWTTWEEISECAPDLLLLMPCGFSLVESLSRAHEMLATPRFRGLPCVRDGRVVAVDGSSYFNRPGPRIADGFELLAAIFRAEVGSSLPEGAAWVMPAYSGDGGIGPSEQKRQPGPSTKPDS